MKQKVFLSYAWQDRDRVELALQRLRDAHVAGVEGIIDITDPVPDVKLGQDLRAKIRDQIEKANVVVLIWTKEAEASDWVQYEVGMADALGKPVVVVAEAAAPELPEPIAQSEVVTLND